MKGGEYSPGALRLVFEETLSHAPKGSQLVKRRLYNFLESIGDYDYLRKASDSDRYFSNVEGQPVPRYPVQGGQEFEYPPLTTKTIILQERTWPYFLNKLLSLCNDDTSKIALAQPIRFIQSESDPEPNTPAMSISLSRRSSIEDLSNTRQSKRRKESASVPVKKTRAQLYDGLDMKSFFAPYCCNLPTRTTETLGKLAEIDAVFDACTDIVSRSFFNSCYGECGTEQPTLAQWIQFSLRCLAHSYPVDARTAEPFLALYQTEILDRQFEDENLLLLACHANLQMNTIDREFILKELAKYEAFLVSTGRSYSDSFPFHFHCIKCLLSTDPSTAEQHIEQCLRHLNFNPPELFGSALSVHRLRDHLEALKFKGIASEMLSRANDLAWFKYVVYKNTSLEDIEACFKHLPNGNRIESIKATVSTMSSNDHQDLALKWTLYALYQLSHLPRDSFIVSLFEFSKVLFDLRTTIVDSEPIIYLLSSVCWLTQQDCSAEPLRTAAIYLWATACYTQRENQKFIIFAWNFLSVDGIDRDQNCLFLGLISEFLPDGSPMLFHALRVANGIPKIFDFDDQMTSIEPSSILDFKKTKNKSLDKLVRPDRLLRCLVFLSNKFPVEDYSKFSEILDFLIVGLTKQQSHVVSTNNGILDRFFKADLSECFSNTQPNLFKGSTTDQLIGEALYRKVKLNDKKTKDDSVLSQQESDLVKALASCQKLNIFKLLCRVGMTKLHLALEEDFNHLVDNREQIANDVKLVLRSIKMVNPLKAKVDSVISECYLLLSDGVLSFLLEDFDLKPQVLDKLFVENVKLSPKSDAVVYRAFVHLARGHVTEQWKLLSLFLSRADISSSIDEIYPFVVSVLELMVHDSSACDRVVFIQQLKRLGILPDDVSAESIDSIDIVTAIDEKKPSGHRHLFVACQLEPTLERWSALFPFLTKSKGSDFANVWLDDSDLPGMDMVYRFRYTKALLQWLSNSQDDGDLFISACKKLCSDLSDISDQDDLLKVALESLVKMKKRLGDAFDASKTFALLKWCCEDKCLVDSVKSELNL